MPNRTDVARETARLRADASAPSRARRLFEGLSSRLPRRVVESGCLLVSEAVTNSVRHGSGPEDEIDVSIDRTRTLLRIVVSDRGPIAEELRPAPARPVLRERGFGLYLIDRLADRWGVDPLEDGKAVWFEFELNGTPTPIRDGDA